MNSIPEYNQETEFLYMEGSEFKIMGKEEAYARGYLVRPEDMPPPPQPATPQSTEMWRARAIMKQTPWKGVTLYDAVIAAIETLPEEHRVVAMEAFTGGSTFDLNGTFAPMLITLLGVPEEMVDQLMRKAIALEA